MKTVIYLVLTIALAILSIFSYVPQIIKIIKTKSVKDLSLASWISYDLYFTLYITLLLIDSASLWVLSVTLVECMLCFIITALILINSKREIKELK